MDVLEELKAMEEIRQLKSRYFRFVDTKDWDGLGTVFCTDGEFDARGATGEGESSQARADLHQGRDAIVRYISEALQSASSVHHGHCHEITIDGPSQAHGVIAMEDIVDWTAPRSASLRGYGHYHEEYRFEDGAWRIWRSKLARLRVDTDL